MPKVKVKYSAKLVHVVALVVEWTLTAFFEKLINQNNIIINHQIEKIHTRQNLEMCPQAHDHFS